MLEESAGIIPINKTTRKLLLVHHLSGHWGFPKGHIEDNETRVQTALRELLEETGIKEVELIEEPIVREYVFEKDGVQIKKKVSYFPGMVDTEIVSIKNDELQNFGWFSYSEALSKLTFSKEVLLELDNKKFNLV